MARRIGIAIVALAALVFGGASALASDPAFVVDLTSCDAAGGVAYVPTGRPLALVGPTWSARTRGLVTDFLHGSRTTLALNGAASRADADYDAPREASGAWSTTWRHELAALAAGASADVRVDVVLDHQMPDLTANGHPLHDARGTSLSLGCALRTAIGAGGGVITNAGATVSVPAGALATDTAITITSSSATPPASAGVAVGTAVEIGPTGTTFAQPVTITLTYDPAALGSRPVSALRIATEHNGSWSVLAATVDASAHTVSAQVTHLSPYVPTAVPSGISGTITDNTGAPIAGAGVAAFNVTTCAEITTSQTTTDATGGYILDLPAGTYRVASRRFAPNTATLYYPHVPDCELAQNVVVSAGAVTTGVDIRLGDQYVYGNGHDAMSGSPLPGVTVTAYSGGVAAGSAVTASNGLFLLKLPDGTYVLNAQPPAGTLWSATWYDGKSSEATADAVTLSTTNQFVSIGLVRRGIEGTVLDQVSLAGIAAATVNVYDGTGAVVATTTTDIGGNYAVQLGDGAYRVGVTRSGYRSEFWNDRTSLALADTVTVSAATPTANFLLTPTYTLSGTVTDAATASGLPNVVVRTYDNACAQFTATSTSATGGYSVELVPATYRLLFISTDGKYYDAWNGGTSCATAAAVSVSANTTINMQLTAIPISLYGRITDAAGNGVSGAAVRAFVGGSNRCCFYVTGTTTASDGSYSLVAAAGTYRVEVVPPAGSGLFEGWAGGPGTAREFQFASDVVFANTAPLKLDLALSGTAHTIAGTVKDGAGNGLGYALIVAFNMTDPTGLYPRASTVADASGSYRLTVPASTWNVVAQPAPGHLINFVTLVDPTSDPTGVDIYCDTGWIISGTVRDTAGAAIPSIHVVAGPPSTYNVTDDNWTDATGAYALTVPNGSYAVRFEAMGGVSYPAASYVTQWYNAKTSLLTATVLTIAGADRPGVDANLVAVP